MAAAEDQSLSGVVLQEVVASAASLDQEQRARASVELQLQRVNQEKQALEEKLRLLSKVRSLSPCWPTPLS